MKMPAQGFICAPGYHFFVNGSNACANCGEVFPNLVTPVLLGCERDTDGDGDCDVCHKDGGCAARRAKFAVTLKAGAGPMADTHERTELRAWRLFGAEVNAFLCQALAAQGETPDAKLVSLQHALAELLNSPAAAQPQVNTTS